MLGNYEEGRTGEEERTRGDSDLITYEVNEDAIDVKSLCVFVFR